jgi:GTP pyrophosphokinase
MSSSQESVKQFPLVRPIDFAYSVHSDVGDHCMRAKVNAKIVPLKYQLRSGDTIEIMTSPGAKPSKDWLKVVKTSRAKTKIRQWFTAEEREKSITLGKEILDKELRKYSLQQSKLIKSGDLAKVAGEFSFQGVDDLIAAVGYGKLTANQIIGKILPQERLEQQQEEQEGRLKHLIKRITRGPRDALLIKGIDNVMVRYAGCCNPLPGDKVVGFITRAGVTIHTLIAGIDRRRPHRRSRLNGTRQEQLSVEFASIRTTKRVVGRDQLHFVLRPTSKCRSEHHRRKQGD